MKKRERESPSCWDPDKAGVQGEVDQALDSDQEPHARPDNSVQGQVGTVATTTTFDVRNCCSCKVVKNITLKKASVSKTTDYFSIIYIFHHSHSTNYNILGICQD